MMRVDEIIAQFLEENVALDDRGKIRVVELRERLYSWCQTNSPILVRGVELQKYMRGIGIQRKNAEGTQFYYGISYAGGED